MGNEMIKYQEEIGFSDKTGVFVSNVILGLYFLYAFLI